MKIRVSFDDHRERVDAIRLARYLVKVLNRRYRVRTTYKVYKNRENSGGRIYIDVEVKNKSYGKRTTFSLSNRSSSGTRSRSTSSGETSRTYP